MLPQVIPLTFWKPDPLTENEANRRKLFRLRFPIGERPSLTADSETFNVIELAENSARLEFTGKLISWSSATSAMLEFKSGTVVKTSVTLSRVEDDHFIVTLEVPVEQKELMIEQRRLLAKYGKAGLRDI